MVHIVRKLSLERTVYRAIAVAAIVALSLSTVGRAQCASCEERFAQWMQQPPFEQYRQWYNPYTLGLPAGSMAPDIPGVSLEGKRTFIYMLNGPHKVEEIAVLRVLSMIDELQVVAVLSGHTPSDVEQYADLFGPDVQIVPDPLAAIVCATYQVGSTITMGRIAFFVDESRQIVLRRSGKPGWTGYEDAAVARSFATTGALPADTITQPVLWYGDQAPWPSTPLETVTGESFFLKPGVVRLFFWGVSTTGVKGRLMCDALNGLRQEFPEVEFLRLAYYMTLDSYEQLWLLGQQIGLAQLHPEYYGLSLNEARVYAQEHQEQDLAIFHRDDVEYPGWINAVDPNKQLGILWNTYIWPSVMVLAGDGTVLLPLSPYEHKSIEGETRIHPGVVSELRAILNEAIEVN